MESLLQERSHLYCQGSSDSGMFLIVVKLEGSEKDFSAPPPATTTADALGAMFISKPNRIHMPVLLESKMFSFNL